MATLRKVFIEPGDWEGATGECLPEGNNGIEVVTVDSLVSFLEQRKTYLENMLDVKLQQKNLRGRITSIDELLYAIRGELDTIKHNDYSQSAAVSTTYVDAWELVLRPSRYDAGKAVAELLGVVDEEEKQTSTIVAIIANSDVPQVVTRSGTVYTLGTPKTKSTGYWLRELQKILDGLVAW